MLAATMLAGRVGSAMAAELGTMRVTEQIDALESMGANPIHYLVVPRFLACLLADSGAHDHGRLHGRGRRLRSTASTFWASTRTTTGSNSQRVRRQLFDLFSGIFKSVFFGAAIALVSCYRGFHCDAGRRRRRPGGDRGVRLCRSSLILVLDLLLGIAARHGLLHRSGPRRLEADLTDVNDGRRRPPNSNDPPLIEHRASCTSSSARSRCCARSTWRFRAGRRWRSSARAAAARRCCSRRSSAWSARRAGEVLFDGQDLAKLERQGADRSSGCGSASCFRTRRCSTA